MSNKHDLEPNDPLKGYYQEIGDGMEPPAELVKAVKTGVFLNPGAKPSAHVWKFTKAVACYALGIALFLGGIALLPKLLEGRAPAGTQVTTTVGLDVPVPHDQALSPELEAQIDAAYQKKHGRSLKFDQTGEYQVWYLGTYNGSIVLYKRLDGIFLAVVEKKEIAGYEFVFSPRMILCVYKEGEIKDLEDAYKDQWLMKEDIAKIKECYQKILQIDYDELLKEEILKAYADDRTDIDQISVQILAQDGDLCAVWIDDPNAQYISVVPTPDTVFGLTFDYGGPQQILIYKRGIDYFYTIPEAAYYDEILSKEFVKEIYIAYNLDLLDDFPKRYCTATVDEDFSENQILVTVFPDFDKYPYSITDFDFLDCKEVQDITEVGAEERTLLLTLNQSSKKNVLSAIKRLEVEADIYCAMPYGYEKTPDLPAPPVTDPDPAPPVTQPVGDVEYCLKKFKNELNKNIILDRILTSAEINQVRAFLSQKDANLALACTYEPFSDAHKISLYELMYASDIKQEFPDNPYQNDGSMMTVSRIREVVLQYMGISVTRDMLDRLVADGAEYFPELDAYGFPHTDASGFVPSDPMYGYLLEDGRWLVHLCSFDAEGDHIMVLLQPRTGGFWIDAGQRVYKWDIPGAPETPVVPSEPVNIEGEIARAYADRYGKDVHKLSVRIVARDPWATQKYYAVFVDHRDVVYANKLTLEKVDGLFFRYNTTQPLLIYSNGVFYSVSEAFSQKVMNHSEISDLHSRYQEKYSDRFDTDDLRQFAEMEIKQLCPERFGIGRAEDYSVRFVMTVGKDYILYIDGPISITDTVTTQKICGLEFVYPTSQVMEFYQDGKFYSLPEAYESGLLYRMSIQWLYGIHNPAINKEVVNAHISADDCEYQERDHSVRFVAKMGDRCAVFIDCPKWAYLDEVMTVTINGLDFVYGSSQMMDIYYNGKFYSVKNAFEKGVLSENQLRYLYEIYRGNYSYLYEE